MKQLRYSFLTFFFLFPFLQSKAWNTPGISSPSHGSSVWVGVILDWNAVSGSQQYQLQVDTSAAFNSPLLFQVVKNYINSSGSNTDTQHTMENLMFGKTYYWRVRAWITGDTSAWSTPWTFITRNFVTMSSPAAGSSVWTGHTVDWLTHIGVGFYDLQVDTSAQFNSPLLQNISKTYINSSGSNSDTEQYLDNLLFGQTYYWRVRARNIVDTSAWSTPWTFITRNFVTMSSPSTGSSVWTGHTVDWLTHIGVGFYDLQVDTSAQFNSPLLQTISKTYINSSGSNSDTEQYLDNLFFGQTYYWRVRARNAADTSVWSTPWTFITRDYVTLSSPNIGQLNVAVAGIGLDWIAHTGIAYYQLQIDTTNLFNSISLVQLDKPYINSSSSNNDTYQHTGPLLSNRVYFWRVRAVNAIDTSEWTTRYFSTGSNPILIPSTPVLIAPSNGISDIISSVTLQWQPSTNATSYQFLIDTISDFSTATSGITISTSQIINSLNNNNKIYYWKVRALNGVSIYSDWSVVWIFTTGTTVGIDLYSSAYNIYPNPFIDFISVINTSSFPANVRVINMSGQLLFESEINSEHQEINLSHLQSGIYQIQIDNQNGIFSGMIIRQ